MSDEFEEVGYCKPPKNTRWKKGQSGNPRGRKKGARGLKTDLHAELASRMEIRMNGKSVSGTRQQLMLRTLSARAAAGDVRASSVLLGLIMQVFGVEDRDRDGKRLSKQDQQILDQLLGAAEEEEAGQADTPSPDRDEVEPVGKRCSEATDDA